MDIEIKMDGKVLVKMNLNPSLLAALLRGTSLKAVAHGVPKSTPATKAQIEDLLSRIDGKSVVFLKLIAGKNGMITWGEMRSIFGIEDEDDWSAFSASYGKGITRAFRHILGDKSARLVWWDDDAWDDEADELDSFEVYVDGAALQALRETVGVTNN
jgi:hypothetical protein